MSKTLYSVYRYIVLGLFLIINIWLFLLSIFSTSRLTADASEHTYYTGDHAWLHIIILVVLIASAYFYRRFHIPPVLGRQMPVHASLFHAVTAS
jgi:Kef-type K+ transport system membrane component KefB